MFRGSFEHTIDPKGRVSVPAKFREVIFAANDDRVVITNFQSQSIPCLDVHPYAAWLRLEERMSQQSQFDPRVEAFMHYYISTAQDCQVDKQGRILLPPLLRAHAKLRDAVTIVGFTTKFQIFDQKAWNEVFNSSQAMIFNDPTFFSNFRP